MPTPAELALPLNQVFVDFENVNPIDASVIGAKAVSFVILLGAKQTKLDATLVEKLMEHAPSVQLIRLTSSGKNALDFALAYYLGRAVIANPAAVFHIVSKDTGFDPLVAHLRSRHIHARRHDSFATLPFSGPSHPLTAAAKTVSNVSNEQDERLTRMVEHLQKHVASRPKKKKTLLSHIRSTLGNGTTEHEAVTLLDKLRRAGQVSISDKDAVTYHL